MPILASFLRKNQRALKLSTLTTLDVLVTNYGKRVCPERKGHCRAFFGVTWYLFTFNSWSTLRYVESIRFLVGGKYFCSEKSNLSRLAELVTGTREERCTFLRYKHRGRSFLSLISFIGHLLTQENISGVLTEIPPLISESDLHISQVRTSKETKGR